ncbi:hypothetical protein OIDMADRAFT_16387 [Oidiodendron maius Zn]|uniref:Uncharacterized protein n=1 Tax=Oidiodendron maius (strain Zn) TaxID=913774 RepID=A0A0C3D9A0_OIDMZ|nr:hypothetical protein OIDMADRAFT_16387 [Oidiodendron maius Zn]
MGLDVRYAVNLDTFIKVLFDDDDNRTTTRGLVTGWSFEFRIAEDQVGCKKEGKAEKMRDHGFVLNSGD